MSYSDVRDSENTSKIRSKLPPKKSKEPMAFQALCHLVLSSVDPMNAVELKCSEKYEQEVSQRDNEGVTMTAATYNMSIFPMLFR